MLWPWAGTAATCHGVRWDCTDRCVQAVNCRSQGPGLALEPWRRDRCSSTAPDSCLQGRTCSRLAAPLALSLVGRMGWFILLHVNISVKFNRFFSLFSDSLFDGNIQGGAKYVYSCKYTKRRVDSCAIINYCIIFHTNNYENLLLPHPVLSWLPQKVLLLFYVLLTYSCSYFHC